MVLLEKFTLAQFPDADAELFIGAQFRGQIPVHFTIRKRTRDRQKSSNVKALWVGCTGGLKHDAARLWKHFKGYLPGAPEQFPLESCL